MLRRTGRCSEALMLRVGYLRMRLLLMRRERMMWGRIRMRLRIERTEWMRDRIGARSRRLWRVEVRGRRGRGGGKTLRADGRRRKALLWLGKLWRNPEML